MMVNFIKENTYFASYPYEVFLYLKYQQVQNLARAINRTGRIFYACASACESDCTRLLTWPVVGVQAGMFFCVSLRVIKKFRIEVIKFSPSNDNWSLDQNIPWYFVALKGSPSAEPSLCFLKDIITKFCFINSILTTDISIESSFKVSFVFTAAINSKRVLNFPWLGNSLIFKNAISDVTSKYDYLNISSFPVESSNMKRRKAFHSFHFAMVHTNLHLLE